MVPIDWCLYRKISTQLFGLNETRSPRSQVSLNLME